MSGRAFNIANYSNSNNFAISFLSNFKSKWNYLFNINWLKINPNIIIILLMVVKILIL